MRGTKKKYAREKIEINSVPTTIEQFIKHITESNTTLQIIRKQRAWQKGH